LNVLIITRSNDNECVDTVSEAIRRRGGRPWRLDTDRYPSDVRMSSRLSGASAERWVELDGERLDLQELRGIWHRRLSIGRDLPEDMDRQMREASLNEARGTLFGMLTAIDVFRMDPVFDIRHASSKELQLRLAAEVGLETPRTLFSNDPDAVRAFALDCDGNLVTKMLSSFAIIQDGQERVVFTNPVSAEDLRDLDGLRYCPMTFQERLEKRLELRTTVIGDRVFTASIDSASNELAREDWRRQGNTMVGEWRPFELDTELRGRVLALMDALGLNYGAIDFVVTPEGRTVFLEINPVGEFFWLERAPGLPLSDAIADVLLGRSFRRPPLLRPVTTAAVPGTG